MISKRCQHCGGQFSCRKRSAKFCSRRCSAAVQAVMFRGAGSAKYRGGPPQFVCRVCGVTFGRVVPAGGAVPAYCGRTCMTADYRTRFGGEGNPAWRGGRWPYKGRRWKDIAGDIIARDGSCADCGGTDSLIVHHNIPQRFWLVLDESNRPDNLVTVCRTCHPKRPEHYWVTLPDPHFDAALHSRTAVQRQTKLVAKPPCKVCGAPVRWAKNVCCSVACANTLKWQSGTYVNVGPRTSERAAARNTRTCAHCGKTFVRWYGRYCCRACFLAAPAGAPGKGKKRPANV